MADRITINTGSGARPIPETIRQMIENGLAVLRADAANPDGFFVKELFSLYGEEVVHAMSEYLSDHPNIPVVLNWPRPGLSIPQIAVVTSNEDEDAALDLMGDQSTLAGRGFYSTGYGSSEGSAPVVGEGPITQREQRAYGENIVINIYVRAEEPELCIHLSNLIRLIAFINKLPMIKFLDFHNMMISIAEIAHDANLFPEFAYTRQVTLRGQTFFDFNLDQRIVQAFDFEMLVRPSVFCADPGMIPVAVKVPFDDE